MRTDSIEEVSRLQKVLSAKFLPPSDGKRMLLTCFHPNERMRASTLAESIPVMCATRNGHSSPPYLHLLTQHAAQQHHAASSPEEGWTRDESQTHMRQEYSAFGLLLE